MGTADNLAAASAERAATRMAVLPMAAMLAIILAILVWPAATRAATTWGFANANGFPGLPGGSPVAIAVDNTGDVFLAAYGVFEQPAGGGPETPIGNVADPGGVAVDNAGDVFISDVQDGTLVEVPSGGGAQITLASGLNHPRGVAVDAGQLLVALVSGDGPARVAQHSIVTSTPPLSWTRASQANAQAGDAEVWYATAPAATRVAQVNATLARPGYTETIVVQALHNATGIGATNATSGDDGLPTLALTNTQAGSRLLAVGEDPSAARAITAGPGQALLHHSTDPNPATQWAQDTTAPTPSNGLTQTFTDVRLGTAGRLDDWDLAGVEVK